MRHLPQHMNFMCSMCNVDFDTSFITKLDNARKTERSKMWWCGILLLHQAHTSTIWFDRLSPGQSQNDFLDWPMDIKQIRELARNYPMIVRLLFVVASEQLFKCFQPMPDACTIYRLKTLMIFASEGIKQWLVYAAFFYYNYIIRFCYTGHLSSQVSVRHS